MTYFPSVPSGLRMEVAFFSWVNKSAQSVGQSFDITLLDSTWKQPPSIINGDTIQLPRGHYFGQAFIYITRTASDHNARFIFSVDGTNVGAYGQSDMFTNFQTDTADFQFTVESSASLTLDLLAIETQLPTVTDNSRIVLWRSNQFEG
jgi:hypothetical protein